MYRVLRSEDGFSQGLARIFTYALRNVGSRKSLRGYYFAFWIVRG